MSGIIFGLLFSLLTAVVVILGDTAIKIAADEAQTILSRYMLIGIVLYGASALLWFLAMRHVSLSQGAVAYSMFTLIALCLIGAYFFDESIGLREWAGIGCACLAVILMARVA